MALALKKQGDWEIRIWARDQASLQESEAIVCPAKASCRLEEIIPGAKIVVLCTPIVAMGRLARQIYPLLDHDAVVTDVGSVKTAVMCELAPIFNERFVGGHPMAGSEQSGVGAARANLFEGAVCILTPLCSPEASSSNVSLQAVRKLWSAIGTRIFEMSPEEHDASVAMISHLPHAAAVALVQSIGSQNISLQEIAGGGYRDTTRVAVGSPDLWVDIFLGNREPILQSISEYMNQLQTLSHLLRDADTSKLRSFLKEAKEARSQLRPI